MSGDWVKVAPNLTAKPQFWHLAQALNISEEATGYKLYQLAGWFQCHSDYGKMMAEPELIDLYLKHAGFAKALADVGWLRVHDGVMTLFGFTDASAVRKSLGAKVRAAVLSSGKCAACGSTESLVVDHIVPIVRGGSSKIENLQALCAPCNRSKGTKLPAEWRKHG